MTQHIILSAHNLCIGYTAKKQPVTIAEDINIALKSGSLTALIGANGIGKSTLLRTLTGIQKPLGGEVILNEKDIDNYSSEDLAQ
ncbi:MAG: ABC transporter ATP-binding protein, partial [Bacteroidota bacterium]